MAQAISEPNHSRIIPHTCPQLSSFYILPDYEDGTECFETSAYKIQTPWNDSKESIQLSGHGESLKSRIANCLYSSMFSYRCTVYFIYTTLLIVFELIRAFSTKMKLNYTVRNWDYNYVHIYIYV